LIMHRLKIIKMCNLSPIHIGTGREDYDTSAGELHSDTLSAALVAMGVQTGILDNVETFMSSFRISSAFPFWRDTYFLPKPLGRLNVVIDNLQEHEYRKRLKKVKYVEASLWQQLANGKTLHIGSEQVSGQFLMSEGVDLGEISKSYVSERVAVSRSGETDASPFFFDWHYYDNNAGLYCLLDADDTLMDCIVKLFEVLGENGIGTDKSVGGGKFDVEQSYLEITDAPDANATMLLSLYIPTEQEFEFLFDGTPRYTLLQRGGFMAGSSVEKLKHLRKKTIYAFGVGSTFQTTKNSSGKVADLAPEWNDPEMHPVYRSGKALTVKIKTDSL